MGALWAFGSCLWFQLPMRAAVENMVNKNTLGVKKVRCQSEAALQIGMYDQKL